MTDKILECLIVLIAFLEFSDDDVLDPDVAVQKLEEVAFLLKALPDHERAALAVEIRRIAETEPDQERREFIAGLPETLGLVE